MPADFVTKALRRPAAADAWGAQRWEKYTKCLLPPPPPPPSSEQIAAGTSRTALTGCGAPALICQRCNIALLTALRSLRCTRICKHRDRCLYTHRSNAQTFSCCRPGGRSFREARPGMQSVTLRTSSALPLRCLQPLNRQSVTAHHADLTRSPVGGVCSGPRHSP